MKNIVEIVQEAAGFEPLQKIDPNTQDVKLDKAAKENRLGQAIVPAVLVGFYKYSREERHADNIIHRNFSNDWASLLFADHEPELSDKIADYASIDSAEADREFRIIAELAADKIREQVGGNSDGKKVKEYMTNQRNYILHHLPGALQIGYLLNDNTLDDRTNKMDGPVSSTLHTIEKIFAGSDNPDEKKRFF